MADKEADKDKEAPESGRRLHVTVLLVASRRALDNALGELGFPRMTTASSSTTAVWPF